MSVHENLAEKLKGKPQSVLADVAKAAAAMSSEEAFHVFDAALVILADDGGMSEEEFKALAKELDDLILQETPAGATPELELAELEKLLDGETSAL